MSLGRGLGSLIPAKTIKKVDKEILVSTGEQVLQIPIEQIEPNPEQPRKNFSHLEMEELINSIREYGIIQPLILTRISQNQYQIITGERRWRAAKVLESKTVPGIIRSVKDNEKLELSLLENIQRKDLNPMERARGYQRLINEFDLTQERVGQKLGKARASIANTLRLLTLPEPIQKAIEQERITEGHAKALLSAEDEEKQKALLKRILGLGLTVRETEKIVSGKRVRKSIELDARFLEKERSLAEALGTKVKIIKQNKKIKVIIEAYSDQELDELIKRIIK
ncbi:ParB/RepB/Spo0J family partition protein [Patescibacteria group bacterium]|nr:ParB/RepB/Spo0J family partition protein [Patescibacteria group bacterium]